MSARLTMMAAVATSLFAFAPAASAADLDYPPEDYSRYEPGYEPTYDSGYRSPRYSDPYADGPPPERYAGPPEDVVPPYPPPLSANGKGFAEPGYPPAAWNGKGFAEPPRVVPRYAYREPRCVPRRVVRRRLRAQGWYDFHKFRPRGPIMLVRARRAPGQPFKLVIDRCSGEIVEARALRRRRLGPFAFGHRRGRSWSY
ncbi:MAG: hypothetical protein ACTSSR_00660 [Alphaproteobacteria bacterium]